jgi:hypothetical protein
MNAPATTTSEPVVKRKRGRPPLRAWEAERPMLELLIRSGYGYPALAKHYGVSGFGMRNILKRLGLSTQTQEQWAKERGRDGTS